MTRRGEEQTTKMTSTEGFPAASFSTPTHAEYVKTTQTASMSRQTPQPTSELAAQSEVYVPKRRASISSSSPPHPTVQSTADFLRANSSLDTSYCPPNETDTPRPSLVQYVTWDSDISKASTPSELNTLTPPKQSNANSERTTQNSTAPAYPSLDSSAPGPSSANHYQQENSNRNTVRTEQAAHQPSKALKYHLSHGGDKGLIDVENPYDEL